MFRMFVPTGPDTQHMRLRIPGYGEGEPVPKLQNNEIRGPVAVSQETRFSVVQHNDHLAIGFLIAGIRSLDDITPGSLQLDPRLSINPQRLRIRFVARGRLAPHEAGGRGETWAAGRPAVIGGNAPGTKHRNTYVVTVDQSVQLTVPVIMDVKRCRETMEVVDGVVTFTLALQPDEVRTPERRPSSPGRAGPLPVGAAGAAPATATSAAARGAAASRARSGRRARPTATTAEGGSGAPSVAAPPPAEHQSFSSAASSSSGAKDVEPYSPPSEPATEKGDEI